MTRRLRSGSSGRSTAASGDERRKPDLPPPTQYIPTGGPRITAKPGALDAREPLIAARIALDPPEMLTGPQLCAWLQVPYAKDFVDYLLRRRKIPRFHVTVNGERETRFPLGLVRQWIADAWAGDAESKKKPAAP